MTSEPCWRPDLLRRFMPTPYVFNKCVGSSHVRVESNDLEIALSIRRSNIVQRQGERTGGLLCKLIRDLSGPVDESAISIVSAGTLRVLYMGKGTILIHDHERLAILGFITSNVKAQELVSSLIPALLDTEEGFPFCNSTNT
jgi:hypothetical protein